MQTAIFDKCETGLFRYLGGAHACRKGVRAESLRCRIAAAAGAAFQERIRLRSASAAFPPRNHRPDSAPLWRRLTVGALDAGALQSGRPWCSRRLRQRPRPSCHSKPGLHVSARPPGTADGFKSGISNMAQRNLRSAVTNMSSWPWLHATRSGTAESFQAQHWWAE